MKQDEVKAANGLRWFLYDGDHVFAGMGLAGTEMSVCNVESVGSGFVTLGLSGGSMRVHESLTPAEARRLAHALMLCAEDVELRSRIEVERVSPPISDRRFDWRATFKDYDEGDPMGYGHSREEAIENLIEAL